MAETMNRYGRVGEIFSALIDVAPTDEIRNTISEFAQGVFEDQREEEATSFEAEIVRAIVSCLDQARGNRLPIKLITEIVNQDRDERDRVRPQRIGWVLARLGFKKGRMPDTNGSYAILLDNDLISRLATSYDVKGIGLQSLITPSGDCTDAQMLRDQAGKTMHESEYSEHLSKKGRHKEQASGTIDEELDSDYDRALGSLRLVRGPMSWDYAVSQVMALTNDRASAEACLKRFQDEGRLAKDPGGYWRLVR